MMTESEYTRNDVTASSGSAPTDAHQNVDWLLAHVLLEAARRRQEELPGLLELVQDELLITSGGTSRRVHGWFAADAWQLNGSHVHELFLNAEFRNHEEDGANVAEGVLTTLLHEGAHAWAQTQAIQDTSRDDRYHNRRFAEIALQLGLEVVRDPQIGHRTPGLTGWARHQYADLLHELGEGLTLSRPSRVWMPNNNDTDDQAGTTDPSTASPSARKKYVFARCKCETGRSNVTIRVARGGWRPQVIQCRICGEFFQES